MKLTSESQIELNNGVEIPRLGFGTWDLRGKTAYQSVKWALEAGYKLIDTASFYGNEKQVGKAIRDSEVNRSELFLTSKVWDTEQGYESAKKAFERSIKKLNVDYLDLYLIHWPRKKRLETWKALTEIYDEGKVKAIGVSNFTIEHLKELLDSSSIIPGVNQVEFHPFLFQKQLMEFCFSKDIQLEAYSPLARAHKFSNPIIQKISEKYNKTEAQIFLRWGLQHGLIEIPKSSDKNHIQQNRNVFDFELSEEDMGKLDGLNQNYRVVEDPVFN